MESAPHILRICQIRVHNSLCKDLIRKLKFETISILILLLLSIYTVLKHTISLAMSFYSVNNAQAWS